MDTTINKVKEKFNQNALQYDNQRRKLIPCFDDFYSIPISIIETYKESPRVLDIGAGTGLFSSFIRKKFPKAKMTLIDISENMLEQAKSRFKEDDYIDYLIADYTEHKFEEKFDIVVSSLSIHHLTDEAKKKLFDNIYFILNPDGVFINADQVLGHTPFIDSIYKNDWKNKINRSGLKGIEIQAAHERMKLDKMTTLVNQINWLINSGFKDVDCVYKYFNFVVLFARKS
ncbi:class I SAM-dependent methyltransferase [Metabacillus hrfriensis]|uniref:Class I SAM-dependent methyltransferase n=1 Tax=Metabacillus hrfriensis TaxID=3048891 RepID=A0ACD4RDD8_9BACI|nr:class I SAM-dependent methyltransferase [Metabacillus sp. CT-WN-B3]UOK58569.1 class I SAM-dependent methyltransferase [Bacillus sp. OVS6]WHZ58506.1 class I SAM-dependent methyltransferase [Metabacillus sp. CT-WN-B3]